jgi:hypothetical protein
MVVVNSIHADEWGTEVPACSRCGKKIAPPFIHWWSCAVGGTDFCLCGDCCVTMEKGFTADLIQLSAITRLRRLYPDLTLNRAELGDRFPDRRKNIVPISNNKKPDGT